VQFYLGEEVDERQVQKLSDNWESRGCSKPLNVFKIYVIKFHPFRTENGKQYSMSQ